jgi:predicted metal-dependent phosphoesterase TrpH
MKIDMHCHSTHSADGEMSVKELLKHAKKIGLDGVAITDHNEIDGALEAYEIAKDLGVLVVRGMEISSRDGHVLAYGITEIVPSRLSATETQQYIQDLGGICVAAHPFRWYTGLKRKALKLTDFHAIEACNGRSLSSTNKKVERIASKMNKSITGGSDAHIVSEIGSCITIIDEPCEREEDVLDAVLKRRTKVSGTGRSIKMSVRYARKCIGEWFGRGMRRI